MDYTPGLRLVTQYSSAEVIELAALDLWVFRVGAFETSLVDGAAVGRLLDPLGRPLDTQVAYRVSARPRYKKLGHKKLF